MEEFSAYKDKFVLPKGKTASEKIDNLLNRYRKILEDCRNDNSEYRIKFAECHEDVIKILTNSEITKSILDRLLFKIYLRFCELERKKYLTGLLSAKNSAELDASALIYLELHSILDAHVYV